MKRYLDHRLTGWKNQKRHRKPLIMRGARQTGKTYAVRELGKKFNRFVELNFEKQPSLFNIFEKDLDPRRICRDISLVVSKDILPGETLLFFDEIQNCPKAITALRYFYEDMPDLHVIGAGSLLEFALGSYSVPVGRVQYEYVYPFTMLEFFSAIGHEGLVKAIEENENFEAFSEPVHQKAVDLAREYCFVGGMPGVIGEYITGQSPLKVREEQNSILQTYTDDVLKYKGHVDSYTVQSILRTLPGMVGQKTTYSALALDATPYKVKQALEVLEKARVIRRVRSTTGAGLPLGAGASEKFYKTIFLDVGLMQCAAGMDFSIWAQNRNVLDLHNGSIAEQCVGQEIQSNVSGQVSGELYYWHRRKTGSQAEVDYLIQRKGRIIPLEVKSGAGGHMKSMHQFFKTYPESPYGIKVSQANFHKQDNLISIPLYAISLLAGNTEP